MKHTSLCIFLILVLLLVTAGIPSAAATPPISDVRPSSGPNTQTITVTITGDGFTDSSRAQLKRCAVGDSDVINGVITSRSPTHLTVDFPLSGHKVGLYDVKVFTPSTVFDGTEEVSLLPSGFEVYKSSGSSTTTTKTTGTTKVTTYATESAGENSVFFETNPSGATIYLDGENVGTSTFIYKTDMDGSHEVIVKLTGYEDYEGTVTIVEGQRARFYALLTPLSTSGDSTTPVKTIPGKPGKTVTTIKKSTMKVPTPLGTVEPVAEESPLAPVTVLWAAVLAIAIMVLRRR